MDAGHERRIIEVWRDNAAAWTRAVRERRIASRRITDAAMVAAILERQPQRVIDLGCGEGWLVRRLAAASVDALGIDAEPALVAAARSTGPGHYRTVDYATLAHGGLATRADVVCCNFALFGNDSVNALFAAVPGMLTASGALIVQTLDPRGSASTEGYRDGWRRGSWQGCGPGFGDAAPWYFRTQESWVASLRAAGLRVRRLLRPQSPDDGRVQSLLLVATRDA